MKWVKANIVMVVALAVLTMRIAMQCVARSKCPDDQGASWSPTNGTVCFGERK